MASSSYRIEAERWLTIAEKLLTARDLHGAKTFAIRARESDPRLFEFSDQIIAVVDTLLAGELRINNNCFDYYAILQLARLTQSMELVATQYRKLALLLNPTRNRLSYADHAFKLVSEAWMVFSNPSKKAMYDRELELSQLVQLGQLGQPGQHFQQPESPASQTPIRRSVGRDIRDGRVVVEEENPTPPLVPEVNRQAVPPKAVEPTRPAFRPVVSEPTRPANKQTNEWKNAPSQPKVPEPTRPPAKNNSESNKTDNQPTTAEPVEATRSPAQPTPSESELPSFWTACPYCYVMFEYPEVYEGCALRCQNCRRAFQAVSIPAPPMNGKDTYFCCWGFFPIGFSGKGKGGFGNNWSPFSAMFATPLQAGGRVTQGKFQQNNPGSKVVYKDDLYIEISDPSEDDESDSDDEWVRDKKKAKNARGRGTPSKNVKKIQNERGKKGNVQNADGGGNVVEDVGGRGQGSSVKKRGAKDLGKLDLNVMFSNEVEEAVPGASEGHHGPRHGAEEDNIEGIGFFEGLDEFLSSLPILSVVGDDKAKAT